MKIPVVSKDCHDGNSVSFFTLELFLLTGNTREFDTLKSKIFDRVRSELFFLSNLFSIFVVYISKYRKYETFN